jgi:hypothetical protein
VELDESGHPRLRSLFDASGLELPAIAMATGRGMAIGIAAQDPRACVGIGIETLADSSEQPGASVLAENEQVLLRALEDLGLERREWCARFRCAKLALTRAFGVWLGDVADEVTVVDVDPSTGDVDIEPGAALRALFPWLRPEPLGVSTARRDDHVWAWLLANAESARTHSLEMSS